MPWRQITCDEREQLVDRLGRSYNGLGGPEFGVISSLMDLDGEFGDPVMDTTWGRRDSDEPVLRDVRWPAPGNYTRDDPGSAPLPDARPCEHYAYETSVAIPPVAVDDPAGCIPPQSAGSPTPDGAMFSGPTNCLNCGRRRLLGVTCPCKYGHVYSPLDYTDDADTQVVSE
jgi:hypothetical protein